MRLKCHNHLPRHSLQLAPQKYIPISARCSQRRQYASGPPQQDIAIIGGGITGLSTAYYLSRGPNPPKITIYEAGSRVGGWLNSKYVDVPGGKVLFEQGPRSLRPSVPRGLNTVALIEEVGLGDELIYIPKDAPSAQLRWLYHPDHLFSLPTPHSGIFPLLQKFQTEPALQGILWGILTEYFKPGRPSSVTDESVGSFLSRRINRGVVDNVASAVFHGIYAGDVWQLSAKSLMPHQWFVEGEGEFGSIIAGIPHLMECIPEDDAKMVEWLVKEGKPNNEMQAKLRASSVVTLKRGLQSLTERLESLLRMGGNVMFKNDTAVTGIEMAEDGRKIKLSTSNSETPSAYDQAISTLFSKTLSSICKSTSSRSLLPSLSQTHAVTVNVVNLYYTDPSTLPIQGFGYLIPRSVPFDQNPERALGVVFDTEVVNSQDTVPGTKVTVMLGGHWWDDWVSIPDREDSISMAKSILKRHLGITAHPAAVHFSTQKDCIPQYTVGHSARMKDAHRALLRSYKGRLKVAGNSYTGVGVNDCLKGALDVSFSVLGRDWSETTGLEGYEKEKEYMRVSRAPAKAAVKS